MAGRARRGVAAGEAAPASLWGDPSEDRPRHRWSPPPTRALLGAGLVALSVGGVLLAHRAAEAPPTSRYVVATRALEPGRALRADDLGAMRIDLPAGVAAIPADGAERWIGRTVRHPVARLELLSPGDLTDAGSPVRPGSVLVAVEVPRTRVPLAEVRAGSTVDVLATAADATTLDGAATTVLAGDVTVVGVDDRGTEGIGASDALGLRLQLPDRTTAVAVVDAAVRSELTLVVPAPGSDRG